jgi:LPS sulfotransferase NodH/GT2 family glycosyltransferase
MPEVTVTTVRSSYLICSNPRSGSWLLAEGLRATERAGRPEEYFNPSARATYLRQFGLGADVSPDHWLERVIDAGTTANGVFGAKVHRMHIGELLALVRDVTGDRQSVDAAVLAAAFPGLTLVHHDRLDRLGQALSWYRALATGRWWQVGDTAGAPIPDPLTSARPSAAPRGERDGRPLELDPAIVDGLRRRLDREEREWRDFFRTAELPLLQTTYEQLTRDYEGTIRAIVEEVSGSPASPPARPVLERQADELNDRWRAICLERDRETAHARSAASPGAARHASAPLGLGASGRAPVDRPPVSIVVVSRNDGAHLPTTIDRLTATSPPRCELIVVDLSDDPRVGTLAAGHPTARIVRPPEQLGLAAARNAGAAVATGDVLVFSHPHVDPYPGWFAPLAEALADPSVGQAAPAVCDLRHRSVAGYGFTWPDLGMDVRWFRSDPQAVSEVPFVCGCFLAMRRSVFEQVGGFDGGLLHAGSEDTELSLRLWRLRMRSVVVPEAVVAHGVEASPDHVVPRAHAVHNVLHLASVHLPADLLTAVFSRWLDHDGFADAASLLDLARIDERRRALEAAGALDTGWFVDHFAIAAAA